MKIAVCTRLLLQNRLEGVGWFTHETLRRVVAAHPEHTFYFFFDRPFDEAFVYGDNVVPKVIGLPARDPISYLYWYQLVLPKAAKKVGADLLICPDGNLPLRSSVPVLPVIHDLNFERYPQYLPRLWSWYYRKYFPKFAQKATRVGTVSEFSKQELVELYQLKPDKIDVVYNGANDSYGPIDADEAARCRREHSNGQPYLLYVGSLHPRKNLDRILQAFDYFKSNSNQPHKLICIGSKMWRGNYLRSTLETMQHRQDVVFIDRMEPPALKRLIAAAHAMVYVSLYEGFGIPIIEAMKSGTPVLTANVTSMPEVAGEAALLVDPTDVEAMSTSMRQVVEDDSLRKSLVEKGFVRQAAFNWDQSAQQLWSSIVRCCQDTGTEI